MAFCFGDLICFFEIYILKVFGLDSLEHLCFSACRETPQCLIHHSVVDVSACRAASELSTTLGLCAVECVASVFAVHCGRFVLVSLCTDAPGRAAYKSLSSPLEFRGPASATSPIRVTCLIPPPKLWLLCD